MPFQVQNVGTHLLVTLEGRLGPQDPGRLADEVEALEDALPAALDRISDLTRVTDFDIGFTEMRVLAVRRRMRTFDRQVKSAIVAATPIQVGMARMFQGLNDNPQIEIRIVPTMEEALRWLNVQSNSVSESTPGEERTA
jgi:hypothetical protein